MVSIYDYLEYQDWIADILEEKKMLNPHFSLRKFASEIQVDHSLLAKVISKKRHLSMKYVKIISEYFNFDQEKSEFLKLLMELAKTKDLAKKQQAYERAFEVRRSAGSATKVDRYTFYSEWYYSVIRNILQYYPFYGKGYRDLGLQLNPPISAKAAKDAIQLLLKLKMIEINEEGRYVIKDLAVTTGDRWSSQAVRNYHKLNIDLARESIEQIHPDYRDISGVTMNIGEGNLEHVRGLIRNFRKEVIEYVNLNADPDRIYHMNVQFFPMTQVGQDHEE